MSDEKQERGFTLADPPETGDASLPSMDFSTFVLSLGASAMLHLGRTPEGIPKDQPAERSLPLARQAIDTLEMIEQKTRGNLDDAEAKLIQSVLYELRLEYVRAERGSD